MTIKRMTPQKLYILFITLYPILNVYKLLLPIGDLIGITLIPYFILKSTDNKLQRNYGISYIYYLFYSCFSIFFIALFSSTFDYANAFSKCFHLTLYGIYAIYFGKKFFDQELFFEVFLKIVNIIVLIGIFQQVIYYISNKQIYCIIPNSSLNYTLSNYSDYIYYFQRAAASQGYRASSVFLEPSHFSMIVVIGLAYRLLKQKNKYDFTWTLLYITAILFSFSTGGILTGATVVIFYILFDKSNKKRNIIFKLLIVAITITGLIYIIFSNSSLLVMIQGRLNGIGSKVYDTSGNRRVLRGFFVWCELDIVYKVFGTGLGNLYNVIQKSNILVLTDLSYSDEMSGLFYNLCSTGIVGSFLYYFSILKNINKANPLKIIFIILFLLIGLFSNVLLHASSILYLVLIFHINKEVENNDYQYR